MVFYKRAMPARENVACNGLASATDPFSGPAPLGTTVPGSSRLSGTASLLGSNAYHSSAAINNNSPSDASSPLAHGASNGPLAHRGSIGSSGKALIHPQRHNLKNRFELIKTLGEGTYGKVKLACEKATGEQVAIKYVKKTKIRDDTDLNRIRREIRILSTLRHPHIVNIRQVFEKKDRIVLVMDCALGGELYDYLNVKRCLTETDTRRIFRQIVAAVQYIHQNNIVHRDLKLENICLDHEGNVKVADFGLANYYSFDSTLKTFCGSPLYASPEIVNGRPYHGPEVDVWSLGVVLYTLAYGAMPFENTNLRILRQQISSGEYQEPPQPCGAAGLIRHMLTVSPARRATLLDVLNHWWVNLGHDLTPDGRPYQTLLPSTTTTTTTASVPATRSRRHRGSASSDNEDPDGEELTVFRAVKAEDRPGPPFISFPEAPALNRVPGARTGRKAAVMASSLAAAAASPSPAGTPVAETSLDKFQMLHVDGSESAERSAATPAATVSTSPLPPDSLDAVMTTSDDLRLPPPLSPMPASATGANPLNSSTPAGNLQHTAALGNLNDRVGVVLRHTVKAGDNENNRSHRNPHWSQTIAESIEQIRARVEQSLALTKSHPRQGSEEDVRTGSPVTPVSSDDDRMTSLSYDSVLSLKSVNSEANNRLSGDADDSSVFVSDNATKVADSDKSSNVFDSDRKPKRSILKRKGKFSGGDSGCFIMADDASPKTEEDEIKSFPSSSSSASTSFSASTPSHLSFSRDVENSQGLSSAGMRPDSLFPLDAATGTSHEEEEPRKTSPNGLSSTAPPAPCPIHHSQRPITSGYRQSQAARAAAPFCHPDLPAMVFGGESLSHGTTAEAFLLLSGIPALNLVCTCTVDMDLTKVVRRRKGILKNGNGGGGSGSQRSSLIEDARKRLSMGSLSSNSSADILDLSYDSGEGEPHLLGARGRSSSASSSSSSSLSNRNSLLADTDHHHHRHSLSSEGGGDRGSFLLDGDFTAVPLDGRVVLEDESALLGPPPPPPPSNLPSEAEESCYPTSAPLLDMPVPAFPPGSPGEPLECLYPEKMSLYPLNCQPLSVGDSLFDYTEAQQVLQQAANLLT